MPIVPLAMAQTLAVGGQGSEGTILAVGFFVGGEVEVFPSDPIIYSGGVVSGLGLGSKQGFDSS